MLVYSVNSFWIGIILFLFFVNLGIPFSSYPKCESLPSSVLFSGKSLIPRFVIGYFLSSFAGLLFSYYNSCSLMYSFPYANYF